MPRTSSSSRWQAIKSSVLLLLVSLSITGLALEGILRSLGHRGVPLSSISNIYPVDDPVLNWRYVPNSVVSEGKIDYRYNWVGFRDVDHSVQKPSGIKRIIILGDSVTEGYGVEWKDVFANILQSRLGAQQEVIVVAAGGLNTPQEVHLLKQEGLLYEPDLVVMNFVLNDADFFTSFDAAQRYKAEKDSQIGLLNLPISPVVKRALKSSALVYFVKERVENFTGRLLGTVETDYYTRLWAKDESRQRVMTGFNGLAGLQRDHGFQVLVIIWPVIMDYQRYGFGSIHERVAQWATTKGFAVIDLLPQFSKIPYRELQVTAEDNIHPNSLGHKVGAETFLTWYHSRYSDDGMSPGRRSGSFRENRTNAISVQ